MLIYYSQRCHPATGWTSEFQLLKELGLYFLKTHACCTVLPQYYAACLPACRRTTASLLPLHFSATTTVVTFRTHPIPPLFVFVLFCLYIFFLRPYKLCRKTIVNQNPVPCSVALSNLLYGTTTSLDRHVLGYHITPDNEPITNSSLK